MTEHILFLTGKLAEKQLRQILANMEPEFSYTVLEMGIKVAALMNADMIGRRLKDTHGATRIIIPGRCPWDLAALSTQLGVPVERGPEEVKDLPLYFGKKIKQSDLSQNKTKIFAEVVEAPFLSVAEILERAEYYRSNGADVIDIGCQPGQALSTSDGVHPCLEAGRVYRQPGFTGIRRPDRRWKGWGGLFAQPEQQ